MPRKPYPFDRSGLALVSDLEHDAWQQTVRVLEERQRQFLSHEAEFRSAGYPWPRDPLHTWSRIWEYPYAYEHLKAHRAVAGANPVAVDFGSGVTFMPFVAVDLGYQVLCLDTDPMVGGDLPRAVKVMGYRPDSITFRQCGEGPLPLDDQSVDCLYCISVLEHIPAPSRLIREFHRVLKSNGRLILTIDLALRGPVEIGSEEHGALMDELQRSFSLCHPYLSTHPADMLTCYSGPFAWNKTMRLDQRLRRTAHHTFWKLLGQDRKQLLACEGLVMEKSRRAA